MVATRGRRKPQETAAATAEADGPMPVSAAAVDEQPTSSQRQHVDHAARYRALHAKQVEERQQTLWRRLSWRAGLLWHHFAITFSPYMLTRVEQWAVVLTLLAIVLLVIAGFYRLLFLHAHILSGAYEQLGSAGRQLLGTVQKLNGEQQ